MMRARVLPTEILRWDDLKPLCESPGPCITITLPAFHQGARALPSATQLKASARTAHEELLLKQIPLEEVEALMDPILELEEDPRWGTRHCDFPFAYGVPTILSARVSRRPDGGGRYFHVVSFLDRLCTDREFYILGLNQKHIRLLHYLDGDCEEVPLPAAIPKNVEEAGAFDSPITCFATARPPANRAAPYPVSRLAQARNGKGQRTAASLLQSCGQRPIRNSQRPTFDALRRQIRSGQLSSGGGLSALIVRRSGGRSSHAERTGDRPSRIPERAHAVCIESRRAASAAT